MSDLLIRRTGPPGASQSTVNGSKNLIRTIANIAGANNLTGTLTADPMLGPLQDNGGPTPTMELLPGSPAIDAGDPAFLPPPDFDQRGASFPRIVNERVDVGAFEVQPIAPPSADFNGDTLVDGSDFLAWQRGFGIAAPNAVKANGDADNDRDVDGADLTVWSAQFGSAPAALAAAESAQAAGLVAPLMAAEDSTSPVLTPPTLTPSTLTSQLVDAAMATQLYAATPAAHRNGWSAAAHPRRHQAIARSTVVVPQIWASVGMPRACTLPTYLNDAEVEVIDGLWRVEATAELISADDWFVEREKTSLFRR